MSLCNTCEKTCKESQNVNYCVDFKKEVNMIKECCVCRMVKFPNTKYYVVLSPEERRNYFMNHKKFTHVYCEHCLILSMRRDDLIDKDGKEGD